MESPPMGGIVGCQVTYILNLDSYFHIVFLEKYINMHLEAVTPGCGQKLCSAGPCCVAHQLSLGYLILALSLTTST